MPPFFRSLQKSFWHTFAPVRAHARIRAVQEGEGDEGDEGDEGRKVERKKRAREGGREMERESRSPTYSVARLPACPPASESHRRCPGASDFHAALRDNRGPFLP